jgi:hypothetical protein
MKNSLVYLILITLLISCKYSSDSSTLSESGTLQREDYHNDIFLEQQKITNPIVISSSKIDSIIDPNNLVLEFLSFWNHQDSVYDNYLIDIVDSLAIDLNEDRYRYFKFEITGSGKEPGEKYGFKSIANKVVIFNQKSEKYNLIFETDIFQPECGTNDYYIKSIDEISINSQVFTALTYHTRIWGCCGSSDFFIDSLVLLKKPDFQYFGAIESRYLDCNNDQCSKSGDTISRYSVVDFRDSPATMTTKLLYGEVIDSSKTRIRYLNFNDDKLVINE